MKVDLHNHTKLCNHAEGEMQEYVQAALACGTKIFGFSDHAPMEYDPKYRMSFSQMPLYEQSVFELQEEFQGRIEILLGYEVDYLPKKMDNRVLHREVDYLIGSVHFLDDWGFDNPEFIGRYEHEDIDVIWKRYFDAVRDMAQSRLFDIVGHLDLIKLFKFLPHANIVTLAQEALEAIKESGMVVELNVAGYRKPIGEPYPSMELLREMYRMQIPITFGSDAHMPKQVGLYSQEILACAKSVGYRECITFKKREPRVIAL